MYIWWAYGITAVVWGALVIISTIEWWLLAKQAKQ